jgi:sugar phosphate isomerase/epimerase
MNVRPLVGVGHFTMLGVSPPELVLVAKEAGFDAIGVRAATTTDQEEPWPMSVGSAMLAETMRRLDDTGLTVLDVEIIRLTPSTRPAECEPLLEVGARLGARFLNVFGDDPDLDRARDTFTEIVQRAEPYGIRPVIEATTYTGIRRIQDAAAVSVGTGGGVIVDPLHLHRAGGTPQDVRDLDESVLAYYQMCDALLVAPSGLPPVTWLPRNQPLPTSDLQAEARARRLLPGEGELPLADLVAALPPGLPVSVEAPNIALIEQLGPKAYARRAYESVTGLLTAALSRAEPY